MSAPICPKCESSKYMRKVIHSNEYYCLKHLTTQFVKRKFVCPICKSDKHVVQQDYNNLAGCSKHPDQPLFRAENDPR